MNLKKFTSYLILCSAIMSSAFGCNPEMSIPANRLKPVTLNYWRVWEGEDAFEENIKKYRDQHPLVTINYRKLTYAEYEQALLEGFASDRGPDIFSINNTWIRKYQSKGLISAMPEKSELVFQSVQGTIKKELVKELKTVKNISPSKLKNDFVDTVYHDVVISALNEKDKSVKERIFGLPLYMDSLVLYYNKDLFNNAGIALPPKYWNAEFQQSVKKLTKIDTQNRIVQSGIALGGSRNINNSFDILSALMMQNGAIMLSDGGQVLFGSPLENGQTRNQNPGLDALRFYSDFANPGKEVYAWNASLDNSLEMFAQGRLAMMIGYAHLEPQIKAKAPRLNFSISSLPQIEGNNEKPGNYADYWVETVAKKSKYQAEAWDFVQFLASADQAKSFLKETGKVSALRSILKEQSEDDRTATLAGQALSAKSWYRGVNRPLAEEGFMEMIDMTASSSVDISEAINYGVKRVRQSINPEKEQ